MLSRLISSTHRITVDIEAVLAKRISIISLNLKSCLQQNIAIIVTFLELYTLSFLILQTISLFTPNMAFVRKFSRKSFFTVFLHN